MHTILLRMYSLTGHGQTQGWHNALSLDKRRVSCPAGHAHERQPTAATHTTRDNLSCYQPHAYVDSLSFH